MEILYGLMAFYVCRAIWRWAGRTRIRAAAYALRRRQRAQFWDDYMDEMGR